MPIGVRRGLATKSTFASTVGMKHQSAAATGAMRGGYRLLRPSARMLTLLWVVTSALPAPSCTREDRSSESTLQRIRRTGVARIAYANEAPYGYRDLQTGQVTGEAPELARIILRRLGAKRIEPTLTAFSQLIPGLKARRYDIIAAGMYITPERCRQIDFSNPTYGVGEAFLVQEGNPKDLHAFADVARRNARLGVVGGTVELQHAEKIDIPDPLLIVFPDNATALAGLRNDRIDAFAGTELTARHLLELANVEDLELAHPFEQPVLHEGRTRSYGGFGFRETDDDLRRAVNRELENFLGSEEHLALIAPFGFTRNELPGDVTAADICGAQNL